MASILNSAARPLSAVAATPAIIELPTLTISGGDYIIAGCVFRGASALLLGCRIGGVPATLIRAQSGIGASNGCVEIYGVRADEIPAVFSGNIPITFQTNGLQDRFGAVAWELDDTDQAAPATGYSSAGSGTAHNTSVTAIAAASLLLGAAVVALSGSSYTAASGQSETDDSAAGTGLGTVWGFEAGVGSGSQAWDWTCAVNGAWGSLALAIAPRLQTITALDPANAATGVSSTIGQLELTTSATAVQGTGDVRIYERDDTASAPTVTRATSSQTTASTTFAIPVPLGGGSGAGGTLVADDLLLAICGKDDDDSITALSDAGFIPIANAFSATNVRSVVLWRRCDGVTEPATLTLTGDSEEWINRFWHIPAADAHPTREPAVVYVSATTTAGNPPGITPPWSGPTLYIGALVGDGNGSASAYPSNADGGTTGTAVSSTAVWMAWAEHFSPTGGTFNFDAFTNSNLPTVAYAVAIPLAEPSTLVETVAASACTFGSGSVIVPIGTLSASTEYFVEFDRVLVGAPGEAKGRETWSFETGAGGGTTLGLTGAALTITSAAGSVSLGAAKGITGAATGIAGAPGSVTPNASAGLAGSALGITVAPGSVSPSVAKALTGAALGIAAVAGQVSPELTIGLLGAGLGIATEAGTVTVAADGDVTIALTGSGLTLTLAAGSVSVGLSRALTGAGLGLSVAPGSVAPGVAKALTGAALGVAVAPGQVSPSLTVGLLGSGLGLALAAGTVITSGGEPVIERPLRISLVALTPRPGPVVLSSVTQRAQPVAFVSLSA